MIYIADLRDAEVARSSGGEGNIDAVHFKLLHCWALLKDEPKFQVCLASENPIRLDGNNDNEADSLDDDDDVSAYSLDDDTSGSEDSYLSFAMLVTMRQMETKRMDEYRPARKPNMFKQQLPGPENCNILKR